MSPECLMAVYISQTGLSKSLSLETHLQLFYYLLQTSSKAKICPRGKHLTSQKVHLQVCYCVCSLLKHVFLPWRNIPWLKHCVMFEKGDERVSLSVIERKIKERKVPHFKMGGGRKMDELKKMNLGREMSSFKMSEHAFPFILLTDFL